MAKSKHPESVRDVEEGTALPLGGFEMAHNPKQDAWTDRGGRGEGGY